MSSPATLGDVKRYWSTHVNDIEVVTAPVGSPEFLEELERYRYEKMPYLRDIVRAPSWRGKRVLEIGCGPGMDLLQLAGAGARVTGMDLTPPAVRLAKRHLQIRKLPGSVLEGNAEISPFADNTFDAVYSHGVLHHTVDTQRAIDEVHRVLKPGGEAVIMLYHRLSWFWLLSKATRTPVEHADADAPIVRVYSTGEVRRLFHKFSKVDVATERFPAKTKKFKGLKGLGFNGVFVPIFNALPTSITGRWGWHLMIYAKK
jgi:SAM-dependent methyltransferase